MAEQVSIPATFDGITKFWHPHIVAGVNDQEIKIAKINGSFAWHAHTNSDELFYLLEGRMTLEIEGRPAVEMKPGDVFTIPQGVRHRPVAENAKILLIEKVGTVNTGDLVDSDFRTEPVDVRK